MGVIVNLIGQKFGRLLVIEKSYPNKFRKIQWKCICDCGNEALVISQYLLGGKTQSCGCLHKEVVSKKFTTHGQSKAPEYEIWGSMVQRCTNKRNKRYDHYGARGVTVCERWRNSFDAFLEDMGFRPSSEHSIERMDNDKGYSPDNCKWATRWEQAINKRVKLDSRSGVKGVIWYKKLQKWCVYITIYREYTYIGSYDDLDEAIEARKQAEIKYWHKKPS